jgi:hypothetical protein
LDYIKSNMKKIAFLSIQIGILMMTLSACGVEQHNVFVPAGKMLAGRINHHAVLLPNGEVAILGGVVDEPLHQKDVEKYDPKTRKFRLAGKLATYAQGAMAHLLHSGKILIAGGAEKEQTAQLYDPSTEKTKMVGSLQAARLQPASLLLQDGRVLIVGAMQIGKGIRHPHWKFMIPKLKNLVFGEG